MIWPCGVTYGDFSVKVDFATFFAPAGLESDLASHHYLGWETGLRFSFCRDRCSKGCFLLCLIERPFLQGKYIARANPHAKVLTSAGVQRGDLEPSEPWPSATMLYTGNAPTRQITPDLTVSRSLYYRSSAVKELWS